MLFSWSRGDKAVFIDCRNCSIVLSQERIDERGGARWERVDGVERQRTEDEGEDNGRDEESGRQGCEKEGLVGKLDRRDVQVGKETYGKFARAPETFNYAKLIDCHCSEEKGS